MENNIDFDFDTIIKKSKTFKLNGKEFKAPGFIPVKSMLNIMKFTKDMQEGNPDSAEEYIKSVYNILASCNDISYDDFCNMIDIKMAVVLFNWISNNVPPEDTLKEIEERQVKIETETSKKK